MTAQWYYSHDGATRGPFSEEEIKEHAARKLLLASDRLWQGAGGQINALPAAAILDFPRTPAPGSPLPDWMTDDAPVENKSPAPPPKSPKSAPDWLADVPIAAKAPAPVEKPPPAFEKTVALDRPRAKPAPPAPPRAVPPQPPIVASEVPDWVPDLRAASAETNVAFRGDSMIMGRAANCDLKFDYPMVSNQHARLSRFDGQMFLEDLGSTNGTYVNHRLITGVVPVQPGDVVGLGTFTLTVQDEGNLKSRDFRGDVTLEADDLAVSVPGKKLIEGCSFTMFPSELVGLMGPSGAGKTTLLKALNGYTPPSEGDVLINGQLLYDHFDEYRSALGYVPQDDIIHQSLTVHQALFYSARLRLPPDFTNDDIGERIKNVLKQLHLEGTENVLIGSPEKKGISGGQRKRVNLAMELLTDPLVLFLDEPTSGLSSEDALTVMKVLRELADQGKTIIITIHQPSLEIFKLLDNLVMIGKDTNSPLPGTLLYYGPAYPDSIRFFNPSAEPGANTTPDDIFRGMSKRPAADWLKSYRQSKQYREFVQERTGKHPAKGKKGGRQQRQQVPFLAQLKTLVLRCLATKIGDRMNTAMLLVQAPIVAMFVVMVFGAPEAKEPIVYADWASAGRKIGMIMFLLSLASLWFGASNAVREIVGEWAIYQRERMVNLRIPAYVASKFAVLGGLSVIQCAALLLIDFIGCGLHAPFLFLYLVLLLSALVGVAVGLLLSALARSSEVAIGLLPIALLIMVLIGGSVLPIHEMPKFTQYLCMGNPARWAFQSMVVGEAGHRKEATNPIPTEPGKANAPEDMADRFFKKDSRQSAIVPVLALMTIFLLLGGSILRVLKSRDLVKPSA